LFGLRKSASLTQAALAERAGWQQPYVARIERGEAQMITALEGLEAFAEATGTSAVVTFVDQATGQVRAQVPLGEAALKVPVPDQTVRQAAAARELLRSDFPVADVPFDVKAATSYQGQVLLQIKHITETMNQDMTRRIAELLELTERGRVGAAQVANDAWQAIPADKR
jgi:transcriptional regulator with XRE-family HTH domain